MSSMWHPEQGVTPTPAEAEAMACVLEGRHGTFAAEVAEFFAMHHELGGDADRSFVWACVAETVRRRECARLMDQ